jgi:dipeptidyl aminopeptidase/acylaminoacyl peptidase
MHRIAQRASLVLAFWMAALGSALAAAPLPTELFFRNPAFSNAMLSPSGQMLAVTVGGKGSRDRLAVVNLQTMKITDAASFDDADVREFRWINDSRLVFNLGDRRLAAADQYLAPGAFAVNADGSQYRALVQRGNSFLRDPIERRELPSNTFLADQAGAQDSDDTFMVQPQQLSEKGADYVKLLRVNTFSVRPTEVDAPLHSFQWLLDDRGELRAVRTEHEKLAALHWREPASGRWRKLREFDRFGSAELVLQGIAPDGKLYVTARPGRDTTALYLYDPATDRLDDKPLVASPQFDIVPQLIQRKGRVAGARFLIDAVVTHWFDDEMKAHQAVVDQLLPSTTNLLTPPRRGDSPWMLLEAFSDVQPRHFLLYHAPTRRVTRLGAEHPEIKAAEMSGMDLVRYKARDGLEIPAFLTLPRSAEVKKNLPLIVYVHGGPWSRGPGWRWQCDVQFLASRGYAVLQPEFRGSVGFGDQHFRASFKQWGQSMQDDLADGARWAIERGIADPKRICIMGASYGGYATLMGLAKDGDLFRCGVDWVGVSDILLMFDAHWSDMSDEWKRYGMPMMIGDRQADAPKLAATSPMKLATRIRNPLLIGHGRVDRRVPIEHGKRLYDAVKPHNANVEWVEYDQEGHGWSLPETEVDWWTRVEAFLAKHIPPAK